MEWVAIRRERRKDKERERDAKKRAEGRQELLEELKAKGVDISKVESKPQE